MERSYHKGLGWFPVGKEAGLVGSMVSPHLRSRSRPRRAKESRAGDIRVAKVRIRIGHKAGSHHRLWAFSHRPLGGTVTRPSFSV